MSLILIADTAKGSSSPQRILEGHELVTVHKLNEAVAKLAERTFDLVVISLHFDESRMFDLIGEVKKSRKNALTPIICFCSRDTEMARLMHESLEFTTRALGAWMYLSEHAYNVFQQPDAELRRVMERCLSEETRKAILQERADIQKQRTQIQSLRKMLEAQAWTPEMGGYLAGLRQELEALLERIKDLETATDSERASIASSRELKDRVSEQVTTGENKLTLREHGQSAEEAKQALDEAEIAGREDTKQSQAQHQHRKSA